MEGYLEAKDIKFIHGRPYHLESQGAVEAFNKTVQDYLSDCYENDKIDGIEWDLRLTLSGFWIFIIRRENIPQQIRYLLKFLESMTIQQYEKRLWWRQNNLVRDI